MAWGLRSQSLPWEGGSDYAKARRCPRRSLWHVDVDWASIQWAQVSDTLRGEAQTALAVLTSAATVADFAISGMHVCAERTKAR